MVALIPVAGPEEGDVLLVGGKAANLSRLRGHGCRVPDWFTVTDVAFGAGGLVAEAAVEIGRLVAEIGAAGYAVRSSGVDEDGGENSFAGQFLSLLDVAPEGVIEAVGKVRASGLAESVGAYREHRGTGGSQAPAVIVQAMVRPRASGVLFTADPATARKGVVVISAVAGLGDRLMAGEASGWTWKVRKYGTVVESVSEGEGHAPLSPTDISALVEEACRLEGVLGAPQDIEWVIPADEDGIVLVQARPITALPGGERRVWDNSNIVESYPGWVSPLTFSFARYVYAEVYTRLLGDLGVSRSAVEARAVALETLLGRFRGRVYYNLASWHALLSALPGYRLNATFMDQMMGVGEPLPPEIAERLAMPPAGRLERLREYLRLAGVAFGLLAGAVTLPGKVRRFGNRLRASLDLHVDIAHGDMDHLADHWRMLERDLLRRWDAPLVNDLVCMIAVGAARKALSAWAGDPGLAVFNTVLVGQGGIVSAEPPRRIVAMADVAAGDAGVRQALAAGDRAMLEAHPVFGPLLAGYIAKFGDRCAGELKLESLTLDDDPSPVFAAVSAVIGKAAHVGVGPGVPVAALFAGRPVRGFLAARLLGWAGARVRDRENLRFNRTQVFGRIRRIALAMGDRMVARGMLADRRDVFMLTVDELLGIAEGWGATTGLVRLVEARKLEAEADMAVSVPDRFETVGPPQVSEVYPSGKVFVPDGKDTRAGLACSPGVVRGVARVITDPRTQSVGPGEIMVARSTDPGWIALFANAAAVVTEKGSILSHSAIVAREMGVPCVVNVPDATAWIGDGETVEVDGGNGWVRKTA